MKRLMIFCTVLLSINHLSEAQDGTYNSLKVGYEGQNLPAGVTVGVNGHVLIHSTSDPSTKRSIESDFENLFLLFVEKGILAEDHAILASDVWLPDYVFSPDYELPTLEEVQSYVEEERHLPGVIGEATLDEQGYFSVQSMLFGQLKNLEELVLHTIAQEKKIKSLEAQIAELEQLAKTLEDQL